MALWWASHCAWGRGSSGFPGLKALGSSDAPLTMETKPSSSPTAIHLPSLKPGTCAARRFRCLLFLRKCPGPLLYKEPDQAPTLDSALHCSPGEAEGRHAVMREQVSEREGEMKDALSCI